MAFTEDDFGAIFDTLSAAASDVWSQLAGQIDGLGLGAAQGARPASQESGGGGYVPPPYNPPSVDEIPQPAPAPHPAPAPIPHPQPGPSPVPPPYTPPPSQPPSPPPVPTPQPGPSPTPPPPSSGGGGNPIIDAILAPLQAQLKQLRDAINAISSTVYGTIGASITALIPSAIELLLAAIGTVDESLRGIIHNIATVDEIMTATITALTRHEQGAFEFLTRTLASGFAPGLLGALSAMEHENKPAMDSLLDRIIHAHGMPDFVVASAHEAKARGAPIWGIIFPIVLALMIFPAAEAIGSPAFELLRQGSNEIVKPALIGIPDLITLRYYRAITQDQYLEQTRKHGLPDDRALTMLVGHQRRIEPVTATELRKRDLISEERYFDELDQQGVEFGRAELMLEASRPLLNDQELRDMFLRGVIDEGRHDELMRLHGYADEQIAVKKSVYYLIPGPADLIHMAIRNVFDPEIVQRFELFSDYPDTFDRFAKQTGISREWAMRYWGAHWTIPSNTEGYEMFQRTTDRSTDPHADTIVLSDGSQVQNVIGLSSLKLKLREADVAPFWRDKLIEVAYSPLTRIDVRRMHALRILDHAGVQRAYLDLGYSPKNALLLADYVEKATHKESRDEFIHLFDGLRRQMLRLYADGRMSKDEATFTLRDFGLTDDEVKTYLAEADLIWNAETAKLAEEGLRKLYVNGNIPKVAAWERLDKYGVPRPAIERLFVRWDLERENRELTADAHHVRDLTKTEILQALEDGLMHTDEAVTAFEHLGYDEHESNTLIALGEFRRRKSERSTQVQSIEALYVNGLADRTSTITALDGLHLSAAQRDAYLAKWTLTREQRTEKLPVATIRDMLKQDFLGVERATQELRRHRYTDDVIAELIAFWHAPKPPPPPRRRGILG